MTILKHLAIAVVASAAFGAASATSAATPGQAAETPRVEQAAPAAAADLELAQRHGDRYRDGRRLRRDGRRLGRDGRRFNPPRYERRRHGDRFRRRDRRHRHYFEGWWYTAPWWFVPAPEYRDRCDFWYERCRANWGLRNPNYRGCMRYHGCY